jgi:RNA polymerase sigma-70 factor (ECF subfamily)
MECMTPRDGTSSTPLEPDGDLLSLIRRQNITDALRLLMQRHGRAVYRYCREALRDAALAEDVHQQVFMQAYRDLPRFAGRSSVRTWLFAVARHRVLDAAKARRRLQARRQAALAEVPELDDVPDSRPSPIEVLDDARLGQALVACLSELGEDARTAVLLRYHQGLSFQEMAELCGENPAVLHARVSRALRRLRTQIEARIAGRARPPGHARYSSGPTEPSSPRYSSGPTELSLPRSRYMRSTVCRIMSSSISVLLEPAT